MNQKAESITTRIKANPERWQRLKNILADALEETSVEQRTAMLRRSCADDQTLLREAEKLLAHDTTAFEEFAEFAATRLRANECERIGERIGAYAIVRELGRGGMGAVYLAERADGQFEKRVAIKVLKRGTDTDDVLRRFRIERQILANLEHPNITRLLDAGSTTDGLPYFVMEFIEGTPITHFVERENVDVRRRLKLFLKVCSAVALAHQNQIVHRDIKPGNVLVKRDGEPKLLDFGIAKLLGVDSDDVSTTVAAERRLTPMYAAPEQRAGQPATVATDVYALGALLCELLTGRPPRSSSTGNLPPHHGSNQSVKLERPSQIVTNPRSKHQLQSKLDQIVVRAMQRDPAQRYSSATGLCQDVERYLNRAESDAKLYSATATGSRPRWYAAAMVLAAVSLAGALLLPLRRNVSKPETINTSTSPASETSTNAVTVRSIAVLPFENLSEEKENAYFADGIQDDVLMNLSKIGDLKVISRTSVMPYRGKPLNLREIGKALAVGTILEGSVRRVGNRVRVNVQLINADTDEHIWAEDYDRELTDVFAIQTDLAQKIANELRAKLSPGEKERMQRKPTENGEAYFAFVQAHNLFSNGFVDLGELKQSEQLYARAIELDPNFALAIARYSQLESWILHTFERTPERREKAQTLAERAVQLQPDLPEAHLARGDSYYYGDNNYDAALKEFEIAQRGLPNESEVYLDIGAIHRRQGKWAESTTNLEKAVSLNPNDIWPLQNLVFNYAMLRNYDVANKTIDRALGLDPTALGPWGVKSQLAIAEKGDFSVAEKAFEAVKSVHMTKEQKLNVAISRADIFLLERKYREALEQAESLSDDQIAAFPGAVFRKYYNIGFAKKCLYDEAGARAALLNAKSAAEEQVKRSPDSEDAHVQLAKALAQLNEKDGALAEAQRATQLLPESKDAFGGPGITLGVAEVHAILGDNDRAIETLEGLLSRPSWVTAQSLNANPVWDALRNDPRFETLQNK